MAKRPVAELPSNLEKTVFFVPTYCPRLCTNTTEPNFRMTYVLFCLLSSRSSFQHYEEKLPRNFRNQLTLYECSKDENPRTVLDTTSRHLSRNLSLAPRLFANKSNYLRRYFLFNIDSPQSQLSKSNTHLVSRTRSP